MPDEENKISFAEVRKSVRMSKNGLTNGNKGRATDASGSQILLLSEDDRHYNA